jgi:hypothetical protein
MNVAMLKNTKRNAIIAAIIKFKSYAVPVPAKEFIKENEKVRSSIN